MNAFVDAKMTHNPDSLLRLLSGAGVALFLALQPALAQGAPAQDLAAHPPRQEPPVQEAVLAPHRAVYRLALGETGAGSNVSDIRGELVYDFNGSACVGYTLNTRLITEVFDRDGKPSTSDIQSESWEDADGKHFRFSTNQYSNGKLSDSSKGTARRAAHNRGSVFDEL